MENLPQEPSKEHEKIQTEVHRLVALLPETMNEGEDVEKKMGKLLKDINTLKITNAGDTNAPRLKYYKGMASSAITSAKNSGNDNLALSIGSALNGMQPIENRTNHSFSAQNPKRNPIMPDGSATGR